MTPLEQSDFAMRFFIFVMTAVVASWVGYLLGRKKGEEEPRK